MASQRSRLILFFIFSLITLSVTPTISSRTRTSFISLLNSGESDTSAYCESWRLSAELDNAGSWRVNPSQCVDYIANYLNGVQYNSDFNVTADFAISYAKTVQIAGDGKDAWIFSVDETLLSNLDYYKYHGYGSEPFNEAAFTNWVFTSSAKAFDASLRLYNAVKKLGFTIIILTGRDDYQRPIIAQNLRDVGYSGWERLILRGSEDQGKSATEYKSEKISKLIEEGFRIRGNVGDQWSDLEGPYAEADRAFKLPNPLYHIP